MSPPTVDIVAMIMGDLIALSESKFATASEKATCEAVYGLVESATLEDHATLARNYNYHLNTTPDGKWVT